MYVVSKYDSSNLKNEKSMAGLCIYEFFEVFPFPLPMGLSKAPPYNLKIYTGYYYYHMVFLQTGKSIVCIFCYFCISWQLLQYWLNQQYAFDEIKTRL